MRFPFLSALVFLLSVVSVCDSQETRIVIPPGFDSAEGDVFTGGFPDGFRFQQLAPADWLEALPDGNVELTAITFRPDASVSAPFDMPFGNATLRISTTQMQLDGLSMTYAENHGPDETVVFEAPLSLTTQNTTATDGVTKEFDIIVPFSDPFPYDRSQGNLLIDLMVIPNDGSTLPDGFTDFVFGNFSEVSGMEAAVNQVGHNGPPKPMADSMFIGGNVLQLTFVPEPSSGCMLICITWMAVLTQRRTRR